MQPSTTKYPTLGDDYILCRTLGKGGFANTTRVKLGFHKPSKHYHAIKIISHDKEFFNPENKWKEIEILSKIQHENIVNMIGYYPCVDYIKKNGTIKKVVAIVMEFIPGHQIFQYLVTSGRFSEKIARTYFRKIIETLEYLQDNNICHRDIKPENMLLDQNFNLKIIDFGLSSPITKEDSSNQSNNFVGTRRYASPETFFRTSYNLVCSDIFSAGVILFMMVSGLIPFEMADPRDQLFPLLCLFKFDEFWQKQESKIEECNIGCKCGRTNFFNKEFRSLINSILTMDQSIRLTLAEIKSHPWYNGPIASPEEIKADFSQRKKTLELKLKEFQEEVARRKKMSKFVQFLYSSEIFSLDDSRSFEKSIQEFRLLKEKLNP